MYHKVPTELNTACILECPPSPHPRTVGYLCRSQGWRQIKGLAQLAGRANREDTAKVFLAQLWGAPHTHTRHHSRQPVT